MKAFLSHAMAVLLTLGVLALVNHGRLIGGAASPAQAPIVSTRTSQPPPPPPDPEALKALDAEERINTHVYATVNRSVVNITSTAATGFFGEETTSGSGSGFILDREGRILTNDHVIREAEAVRVTLYDGSTFDAKLVGDDPSTDLAVLSIDAPADKLFPVSLGDSTNLLVGQKVLAVGNPFGLERTLTTGIISSLDRTLATKNGRRIKGIIQTDAAINPGNSGGPLLNTRGQVIGMNTAIVSQVGQSAGIGFAVPINSIKRILDPLIKDGKVVRADLGVAKLLATDDGLLVVAVTRGGPADLAGLRPVRLRTRRVGFFEVSEPDIRSADRILEVDGKRVSTADELLSEVEVHQPGTTLRLKVKRGEKEVEIPVVLGSTK